MKVVQAFRLANWDTPLWVSPNRRDSRFVVAGGEIVQYWCLHPLSCWAEHLRFHGIRDPLEAKELTSRPWVASLSLPDDTAHLTFDNAASEGIDPDALVDEDWTRCQRWAAARRPAAIVVPSAALPGTTNVVIFGKRVRAPYGVAPFDPAVDVPSDPVADISTVVPTLLPHVRWRGEPHGGYEAWMRGEPEPVPPLVRLDTGP